MWRIVQSAKIAQDTSDPCRTAVIVNGKPYPIGGGAASWNDLADKPFDSRVEVIEVMPKQTLTPEYYDSGEGFLYSTDGSIPCFKLKDGCTYKVIINGVEHTVEAYDADNGDVRLEVGNGQGDYHTEDYVSIEYHSLDDSTVMLMSASHGDEVTVEIREENEIIEPLDRKFVGDINYNELVEAPLKKTRTAVTIGPEPLLAFLNRGCRPTPDRVAGVVENDMFIEGRSYKVFIDDKEYNFIAKRDSSYNYKGEPIVSIGAPAYGAVSEEYPFWGALQVGGTAGNTITEYMLVDNWFLDFKVHKLFIPDIMDEPIEAGAQRSEFPAAEALIPGAKYEVYLDGNKYYGFAEVPAFGSGDARIFVGEIGSIYAMYGMLHINIENEEHSAFTYGDKHVIELYRLGSEVNDMDTLSGIMDRSWKVHVEDNWAEALPSEYFEGLYEFYETTNVPFKAGDTLRIQLGDFEVYYVTLEGEEYDDWGSFWAGNLSLAFPEAESSPYPFFLSIEQEYGEASIAILTTKSYFSELSISSEQLTLKSELLGTDGVVHLWTDGAYRVLYFDDSYNTVVKDADIVRLAENDADIVVHYFNDFTERTTIHKPVIIDYERGYDCTMTIAVWENEALTYKLLLPEQLGPA